MQFIRGMIISDDDSLVAELECLLTEVTSSLYTRKLLFPEDPLRFVTMVKSYAPSIVWLDMSHPARALHVAGLIQRAAPGAHLVALASENTKELLLAAVRGGVRDVLTRPLALQDVQRCVIQTQSLIERADAAPIHRQQILSFLPAKVGSGTSTVALHTAINLASGGWARVALMDLDFDCGLLPFMLRLPFGYGLNEVAELASRMDKSIWSRMVSKYGDLDVIRAGSSRRRVAPSELEHILGFARGDYDVICIDLPGAADELSMSVLEQSDSVFIVCTPDLPSVHLAKRRMAAFKEPLGPRVKVIYNRARAHSPLGKTEVEDILGGEVFAIIENDYVGAQQAVMNGRPVDLDTPLGRSFTHLANKIAGGPAYVEPVRQEAGLWASLRKLIQPMWRGESGSPSQTVFGAPPLQLGAASGTVDAEFEETEIALR